MRSLLHGLATSQVGYNTYMEVEAAFHANIKLLTAASVHDLQIENKTLRQIAYRSKQRWLPS